MRQDVLVVFDDFSSSSPELWGKGKEFVTSRIPSRSSPRSKPWTEVCDSELCLIILETTCRIEGGVKKTKDKHEMHRPILQVGPN
jgi:hypothetical protein